MVRLILYALLAYLSYRLFKLLARKLFPSNFADGEGGDAVTGDRNTELIQDPECGTYFLKQRGVTATVQGKRLYFCSEACRDGYLARHRNG